jgi:hypothetical protein
LLVRAPAPVAARAAVARGSTVAAAARREAAPGAADAGEGAGRPPWRPAGMVAPQLRTGSSPRGGGHGGRTRGASAGGWLRRWREHDGPPESRAELLRRLAGIARGAAPAAGRCEPKGVAAGALGGRRLRLLEVRRVRV